MKIHVIVAGGVVQYVSTDTPDVKDIEVIVTDTDDIQDCKDVGDRENADRMKADLAAADKLVRIW